MPRVDVGRDVAEELHGERQVVLVARVLLRGLRVKPPLQTVVSNNWSRAFPWFGTL